jgi:hypothetical protein
LTVAAARVDAPRPAAEDEKAKPFTILGPPDVIRGARKRTSSASPSEEPRDATAVGRELGPGEAPPVSKRPRKSPEAGTDNA